jgi:hypothetical protein
VSLLLSVLSEELSGESAHLVSEHLNHVSLVPTLLLEQHDQHVSLHKPNQSVGAIEHREAIELGLEHIEHILYGWQEVETLHMGSHQG